jgi:uncharacterized protein (TIRG00374 family)
MTEQYGNSPEGPELAPSQGSGLSGEKFNLRDAFNKFRSSWHGLSKGTQLRLKLSISFLMFASLFVLGKVDVSKSWQAASTADFRLLFLAAAIFLLTNFLNAYRWQLLARAAGFDVPLLKLTQYCFIGLFFNLFLPSTVGGDASRCYYLAKGTHKYRSAFYSVFADRTMGVTVLFLFASCGLLFGPGGNTLPWSLKLPVFAGTIFIFCILPFLPYMARTIFGPDNWVSKQLNDPRLQIYWQNKNLIVFSLFLSIIMQVIIVLCHILVGLALGLTKVPIWYYFVFYPSVSVLGFVTPSFNGIGIREWAYTYFLSLAQIDRSLSLTYALIWLGLITLSNLVGGIVYLLGHFHFTAKDAQFMEEELEVEMKDDLDTNGRPKLSKEAV